MREYISAGNICVKGLYNLEYNVCKIVYILYEDDTFKYIFTPNYSVIDLLDDSLFQGIPGLNLDLRKKEYIRDNIIPVFISERVPQKNREDYSELLKEVNMDYMDPILYLTKTNKKYFGDNFYVTPYEEKEIVTISKEKTENNMAILKKILTNLCLGNDVFYNNKLIDDSNRKLFYEIYIDLYKNSYDRNKKQQKEGIDRAKTENKYRGRKPIEVDIMKFYYYLDLVQKRKITAKEAAKKLGISIDKYYRVKKCCQG